MNEVFKTVHHSGSDHSHGGGCPGSRTLVLERKETAEVNFAPVVSELKQWPVQLHLLNPQAAYFKEADVLIAADCVAYSVGNFHQKFLKGKTLAIACPKLDTNKEIYVEKLVSMINDAKINTITVMVMEVPCCGGLLQMVKAAVGMASRKVPVKSIVVGITGETIMENWM
ncbi:MAG: 4Fe-4S ferredoxin [Bacteroidales bacterium]|nr:4Fe-4S ferredoxin [Bacteroidales bacterium]